MRAFRIQSDTFGKSYFEEGDLPEHFNLKSDHFFIATGIEDYQKRQHPAPRYQYVVTLKGKLEYCDLIFNFRIMTFFNIWKCICVRSIKH